MLLPSQVQIFIIDGILALQDEVAIGGQLNVEVKVKNIGNIYSSSSYIGYYLSADTLLDISDQYLGEDYVSGLYGGGYSNEFIEYYVYDVDTGKYYLLVVADHENHIDELNEDNNMAFVPITVKYPEIDLLISSTSINDTLLPLPAKT
ncbi:MAG: hypothetical protein HC896_12625 [Bacteroidales bacterium]|nr:hypothetical protein [Bacteroidales bacterium]